MEPRRGLANHAEDLDAVREIVTDSLARNFFGIRFQMATDAEQRYLAAMASLGDPPYRTSNVARAYGARDQRGRESLISKGLIWSPRRGQLDLRDNNPIASFDEP